MNNPTFRSIDELHQVPLGEVQAEIAGERVVFIVRALIDPERLRQVVLRAAANPTLRAVCRAGLAELLTVELVPSVVDPGRELATVPAQSRV